MNARIRHNSAVPYNHPQDRKTEEKVLFKYTKMKNSNNKRKELITCLITINNYIHEK